MLPDRKALNTLLSGAWNRGSIAAVIHLEKAGWSVDEIADNWDAMFKLIANETIRAAGLNGDPAVPDLRRHAEEYGRGVAAVLVDRRPANRKLEPGVCGRRGGCHK